MPQSDPHPPTDPKTPADHELTPLESYFDELFNEHMVLPQAPDELAPIEGVGEGDSARHDHGTGAG